MWDIANTWLPQESYRLMKMSSPHVIVLVIDQIWATSLWEWDPPDTTCLDCKPFKLSSLYKRQTICRQIWALKFQNSEKKALVVCIESARHRHTKAFPASGSNDLPLSNPHLPGPHRCADKVLANLPSHVLLPIILLLHRALQPAL